MKIRLAAMVIAVLMAVTLSAMAAGQYGGGDQGNKGGPNGPGGPEDSGMSKSIKIEENKVMFSGFKEGTDWKISVSGTIYEDHSGIITYETKSKMYTVVLGSTAEMPPNSILIQLVPGTYDVIATADSVTEFGTVIVTV